CDNGATRPPGVRHGPAMVGGHPRMARVVRRAGSHIDAGAWSTGFKNDLGGAHRPWLPRRMFGGIFGTWVNAGAIIIGALIGLSSGRSSARGQQFLPVLLAVLALYTGFRVVWLGIGGRLMRVLLQFGVALLALVL